jgi:hypothetical protein
MMPLLLEDSDSMPFHTDLVEVFRALGGAQRDFDWLITNLECIPLGGHDLPVPLRSEDVVLSGADLTRLVESTPLQFLWAVLSGFAPGTAPPAETVEPYPFADGNGALWKPGVHIQHPDAQVEIVCWDSGATLFFARDTMLEERFKSYFPDAVDLEAYNTDRAKRNPSHA